MGERSNLSRAPARPFAKGRGRIRIAQSLTLAGCLLLAPLSASSAQTTDLSAQFTATTEPGLSATETDAFAQPFEDAFAPLEQELIDVDLALPNTAVDLGTFEAPLEEEPDENVGLDLGTGVASYYGRKFHGRRTANGERFDMNAMTAAHKTLPFGTRVRVTNPRNGRSVTVRINDRGPFIRGRTIDLSRAAAEELGMISSGHAQVELDVLAR